MLQVHATRTLRGVAERVLPVRTAQLAPGAAAQPACAASAPTAAAQLPCQCLLLYWPLMYWHVLYWYYALAYMIYAGHAAQILEQAMGLSTIKLVRLVMNATVPAL